RPRHAVGVPQVVHRRRGQREEGPRGGLLAHAPAGSTERRTPESGSARPCVAPAAASPLPSETGSSFAIHRQALRSQAQWPPMVGACATGRSPVVKAARASRTVTPLPAWWMVIPAATRTLCALGPTFPVMTALTPSEATALPACTPAPP